MKNILSLSLHMSLSGTAAFLIYLCGSAVLGQGMSGKMRYGLIKLCLLLYLIPFPLLKYWILRQIIYRWNGPVDLGTYYTEDMIFQSGSKLIMKPITGATRWFLWLWLGIMLWVMIWRVSNYVKFRRNLKIDSATKEYSAEHLEELKTEIGIHRKITVLESIHKSSPFTLGGVHPIIMITGIVKEQDVDLVLRHELQHIKNGDFLIRLLAVLCLVLYFWNPMVYLFWKELQKVQEYNCDEKVCGKLSENQKKAYGNLLIYTSVKCADSLDTTVYLSRPEYKFLKNRIQRVIHPPKKCRVVAVGMWGVALLAAGVPVAAYNPKTVYMGHGETFTEDEIIDPMCDWVAFAEGEAELCPDDESNFSYGDIYFISDEGEIFFEDEFLVNKASGNSFQASCEHTYVKGYLKQHKKNGTGGCTVYTYSCKQCSKCKKIIDKK